MTVLVAFAAIGAPLIALVGVVYSTRTQRRVAETQVAQGLTDSAVAAQSSLIASLQAERATDHDKIVELETTLRHTRQELTGCRTNEVKQAAEISRLVYRVEQLEAAT